MTRRWLIRAALRYRTEPVELLCGASATMWGLWLLVPWWNSFAFSIAGSSFMAAIAPEEVWGAFILLAGAAQLGGLLTGRPGPRRAGALCTFLVRLAQFSAFWVATGGSAPGIPDFAFWSLASLWVWLRLRREQYLSSEGCAG